MNESNWIDKYINTILNGPLPTLAKDSDDIIMQIKVNGIWQDVDNNNENEVNE